MAVMMMLLIYQSVESWKIKMYIEKIFVCSDEIYQQENSPSS